MHGAMSMARIGEGQPDIQVRKKQSHVGSHPSDTADHACRSRESEDQ